MGMIHYVRPGTKRRVMAGDIPRWITNSTRARYILSVVLSAPLWMKCSDPRLQALHGRAAALSEPTGVPHVLDHIIPLNHPRVCGLTVPWNLEVVTAKINGAKSNHIHLDEQLELFS